MSAKLVETKDQVLKRCVQRKQNIPIAECRSCENREPQCACNLLHTGRVDSTKACVTPSDLNHPTRPTRRLRPPPQGAPTHHRSTHTSEGSNCIAITAIIHSLSAPPRSSPFPSVLPHLPLLPQAPSSSPLLPSDAQHPLSAVRSYPVLSEDILPVRRKLFRGGLCVRRGV